MSWFGSQSANSVPAQNFYPVTSSRSGYGELSEKDTTWTCANDRGFQTETQVWYSILGDGSLLLCQVIWSYTGIFLLPATAQMTFKLYNPKTKRQIWRSVNSSGFKPDGRSCKSDQFEVKHSGSPTTEESYTITASLDKTVQISVTFTKPANAPGFKFGAGENGGMSTFGKEQADGKRDGYVVHRFHPMATSSGSIVAEGRIVDAKGDGMFVHAIQGMRPDSLASRWNFAFFTSGGGMEEGKLGAVRAVQMEFETTDSYGIKGAKSGRAKANIGAIYSTALPPSPLVVTAQTHGEGFPVISKDISKATHRSPAKDRDTGYSVPAGIEWEWEGERRDGQGRLGAKLVVEEAGASEGKGGLMEKVDVLAEIPFLIRKGLAAVTGTKPYIYQYLNPSLLEVKLGDETVPVKGWLFNEASFVSE